MALYHAAPAHQLVGHVSPGGPLVGLGQGSCGQDLTSAVQLLTMADAKDVFTCQAVPERQPDTLGAKYADKLKPGMLEAHDNGNRLRGKGQVTKISITAPDRFLIRIGGLWFRIDFDKDVVKWAAMNNKTMTIDTRQEEKQVVMVAHWFDVSM